MTYSATVYKDGPNLHSALILTPLLLVAISAAFFAPVARRLLRGYRGEEISREWIENFSAASYYPMQSLLSDEDFAFLLAQPGFDFSLYRKLRRERLTIFQQYLNRLIADFNRLHAVARLALSRCDQDQSDLLVSLIWLRVRFAYSVLRAEWSYVLCILGSRTLAARAAIQQLEELSAKLTQISALGVI